ncbi:MAG TPA: hypothetical protein VK277_13595 [Acidimicrobiales bacterium]|nr:hypothetical protein [Acidimicrobiales bacterium]
MAVGDRVDQFRALTSQAITDLFDQRKPFGRLALVQVLMLAGDTLVTISLAGSLFFSISPGEAKKKVLLYLLLTLLPFAIVSPLLGPLIDRSRNARRLMVVVSALGRAVLCPFMARDIHSLLLFPEAFLVLVLSKLYLVTRGALVPEMVAITPADERPIGPTGEDPPPMPGAAATGDPAMTVPVPGPPGAAGPPAATSYAALNARLTLLGTAAGFIVSVPGVLILKLASASGVLILATIVFVAAGMAGSRLPVRRRGWGRAPERRGAPATGPPPATAGAATVDAWAAPADQDEARLQGVAHPEVVLGLSANCLLRGLAGFLIFLLAFGLRRQHAALYWYGLALGGSGIGSIGGLLLVPRLRRRLSEQLILLCALWLVAVGAAAAAWSNSLLGEVGLAMVVGVAGSLGQPSFDALAQRYVPLAAQGRAFARFALRQQLVWVAGALVPVVIAFPLAAGNVVMALAAAAGGFFYLSSRRALRQRALPRHFRGPATDTS